MLRKWVYRPLHPNCRISTVYLSYCMLLGLEDVSPRGATLARVNWGALGCRLETCPLILTVLSMDEN